MPRLVGQKTREPTSEQRYSISLVAVFEPNPVKATSHWPTQIVARDVRKFSPPVLR